MRSPDTDPAAHRVQLACFAGMMPAERVERALVMCDEARAIAVAGIRARDPGLTQDEARRVLLRQLLGPALFEAAFPTRRP